MRYTVSLIDQNKGSYLQILFLGPVIRINPEELHFNDIAFVDEIYASAGRKRDKQVHYLNFLAGPIKLASFSAHEHNVHRIRRGALNKFFSRTQISKLQPTIRLLLDHLCDKLIRLGGLNIQDARSRTLIAYRKRASWSGCGI